MQTQSSQVFTGKVKKGMPGFAEFGITVDVQISAIMNPLMDILAMDVGEVIGGQLIGGV